MKIKDIHNNCCLVAMHLITDHDEQAIIDACLAQPNWLPGRGMRLSQSSSACQLLGLMFEHVPLRAYYTLAQFCAEHADGTYWITVRGHALIVHDGKILDPNYAGAGRCSRRRVVHARRVLNPGSRLPAPVLLGNKLPADPFIRLVATVAQARKRNTDGWRIYRNCELHLHGIEEGYCRLSELAEYGYTRKMFRADRRKGFVTIA